MAEILLAIEELHNWGIVFRDLKPDNVVLDVEGHAILTDFGLSREIFDDESAESFCGSYAYLAPEMLKWEGHGKSLDWYLLGVFLYEMLFGIPPFYDHDRDVLFENILSQDLNFVHQNISDSAKDLLRKVSLSKYSCWTRILKRDLEKPMVLKKWRVMNGSKY